jgi:hypothetical protein
LLSQVNLDSAGDAAPNLRRVMDHLNLYVVEQPMTSEAVKKVSCAMRLEPKIEGLLVHTRA